MEEKGSAVADPVHASASSSAPDPRTQGSGWLTKCLFPWKRRGSQQPSVTAPPSCGPPSCPSPIEAFGLSEAVDSTKASTITLADPVVTHALAPQQQEAKAASAGPRQAAAATSCPEQLRVEKPLHDPKPQLETPVPESRVQQTDVARDQSAHQQALVPDQSQTSSRAPPVPSITGFTSKGVSSIETGSPRSPTLDALEATITSLASSEQQKAYPSLPRESPKAAAMKVEEWSREGKPPLPLELLGDVDETVIDSDHSSLLAPLPAMNPQWRPVPVSPTSDTGALVVEAKDEAVARSKKRPKSYRHRSSYGSLEQGGSAPSSGASPQQKIQQKSGVSLGSGKSVSASRPTTAGEESSSTTNSSSFWRDEWAPGLEKSGQPSPPPLPPPLPVQPPSGPVKGRGSLPALPPSALSLDSAVEALLAADANEETSSADAQVAAAALRRMSMGSYAKAFTPPDLAQRNRKADALTKVAPNEVDRDAAETEPAPSAKGDPVQASEGPSSCSADARETEKKDAGFSDLAVAFATLEML